MTVIVLGRTGIWFWDALEDVLGADVAEAAMIFASLESALEDVLG